MIHVLQTGNKPVYKGMCLTVLSILKHTKVPIHYHLMTIEVPWSKVPKITYDEAMKIRDVLKAANPLNELSYYDISKDFIKKFENSPNKDPQYTPASLVRLLALDYIDCDYLIYLDADTMVCNSLEEFSKHDISQYEMGVVKDYLGKFWIKKDYINSGVLYINVKKCKELRTFERVLELLSHKKYVFADQTAIYKVTKYRYYLPTKFNDQRNILPDTVIRHFCLVVKFFPLIYRYNIKQWEVKRLHSKLKIHDFDDLYELYNNLFDDKLLY